MKTMITALLAVVAAVASPAVHAAFEPSFDPGPGGGPAWAYEDVSRLRWMSLQETLGWSAKDASESAYVTSGDWRIATTQDVTTMLAAHPFLTWGDERAVMDGLGGVTTRTHAMPAMQFTQGIYAIDAGAGKFGLAEAYNGTCQGCAGLSSEARTDVTFAEAITYDYDFNRMTGGAGVMLVSPVPEPEAWAMFAVGAAFLSWRRWRAKKALA